MPESLTCRSTSSWTCCTDDCIAFESGPLTEPKPFRHAASAPPWRLRRASEGEPPLGRLLFEANPGQFGSSASRLGVDSGTPTNWESPSCGRVSKIGLRRDALALDGAIHGRPSNAEQFGYLEGAVVAAVHE